jgi:hypothetical protein
MASNCRKKSTGERDGRRFTAAEEFFSGGEEFVAVCAATEKTASCAATKTAAARQRA